MITKDASGAAIDIAALSSTIAGGIVSYSMELLHGGQAVGGEVKRLSLTLGTTADATSSTEGFVIGGAYSNQATIEVYGLETDLLGEVVQVIVGVDVGGVTVRVPVAALMVIDQQRAGDTSTLTAAGAVNALMTSEPLGLEEDYWTASEIMTAIEDAAGVEIETDSQFARLWDLSVYVTGGMSCRAALAALAASFGGFACDSNEWAKVRIAAYPTASTCSIDAGTMTANPRMGTRYEVTGLTVTISGQPAYTYGDGRARVDFADVWEGTAANLWATLHGYWYDPALVTVGVLNPLITPFDRATITEGSNAYQVPTMGIQATYDGGYFGTLSAAGLSEEAQRAAETGAITEKLNYTATAAKEALEAAQAVGQHFWHRATDPNQDGAGTGAFVTDMLEDDFLAGAQRGFPDLSDNKPYSNVLLNALGLLIRRGVRNLASFTKSAVSFFDGNGNEAANVVATFGSGGYQVGRDGGSRMVGDYHSLQLLDLNGNTYFHISDLREQDGAAPYTDEFEGDGTTRRFSLSYSASTNSYTVTVDGQTASPTKTATYIQFATAPASGAAIVVSYRTTSYELKAYTVGTRADGETVGPMSYAEGYDTIAGGRVSHAEGWGAEASGDYSHAEGEGAEASGRTSHAEGNGCTASGDYSHAEGNHTTASGRCSHASGNYTEAAGGAQTVIGEYNVIDTDGDYLFIVGNGDAGSARSNAFTIDWDGAAAASGEVSAVDSRGTIHRLTNKIDAGTLYKTVECRITVGTSSSAVAHGTNKTATGSVSVSGYVPAGVVGWHWVSGSRQNWFHLYRMDVSSAGTVTVSCTNFHSSDSAYGVIGVYVLMVGENTVPSWYEGSYDILPTVAPQTMETLGKTMRADVDIEGIPRYDTTNEYGTTTIIGDGD